MEKQNMERNIVGWFEIYVNDMDRAVKFYETVLDIKMVDMTMPDTDAPVTEMKFFPGPDNMNAGGAGGALAKMEGVSAGAGGVMVYFSSADCAVEEARIVAAGGEVTQSKMDIGEYGFCVMAKDSEGNIFGVHSMQ